MSHTQRPREKKLHTTVSLEELPLTYTNCKPVDLTLAPSCPVDPDFLYELVWFCYHMLTNQSGLPSVLIPSPFPTPDFT